MSGTIAAAPGEVAAPRPIAARIYRWSVRASALLAFAVIVLGATVRLSDAGLSCPDWPGCYGQISVGQAEARPEIIRARWPDRPLDPGRAHLEMTHRYLAGTLGLLILVVTVSAWQRRSRNWLATSLALLVLFQALLGMWTVTLRLEPVIVVAHLIGGLSILAVLWWLLLEDRTTSVVRPLRLDADEGRRLRRSRPFLGLAVLCLGLLAIQIMLGGWTSANHAALACNGFPTCNGAWWPNADFAAGFTPWAGAQEGFSAPTGAALVAIHWTHRIGALVIAIFVGGLALATRRADPRVRAVGTVVGMLLLIQIGLGIANVLVGRPLPLAIAHNATAALLLLALLTLVHRLARSPFATGGSP